LTNQDKRNEEEEEELSDYEEEQEETSKRGPSTNLNRFVDIKGNIILKADILQEGQALTDVETKVCISLLYILIC
jgi:hypothetical protein